MGWLNAGMNMSYDPNTGILFGADGLPRGSLNRHGYVTVRIGPKRVSAHRLAWMLHYGCWPAGQVDHINGVRTDNRIANLRIVDAVTNAENRKRANSNSKSGYLGVSWSAQSRKWIAQINSKGRRVYLGSFVCPMAAHERYLEAKRLLHSGCTI